MNLKRTFMKCNRLNGFLDLSQADGRVTPCCLFDTNHGWKSNIYTGDLESEWNDARERLKKGREKALANRRATAELKKKDLKTLDICSK